MRPNRPRAIGSLGPFILRDATRTLTDSRRCNLSTAEAANFHRESTDSPTEAVVTIVLTTEGLVSNMGFGSYDESEQQNQEVDTDSEEEAVNVHETDHEGDIEFETEKSTDELVDQLQQMKDSE
jgi:hypothetical protein